MDKFTRRDVINTLVGTTTAAVLGATVPASAQPPEGETGDERSALIGAKFPDFRTFIRISCALTGISDTLLAPDAATSANPVDPIGTTGSDPAQAFKLDYFKLATGDPAYTRLSKKFDTLFNDKAKPLMKSTDTAQLSQAAAQLLIPSKPDDGVADLARSIIMVWYFGVWYEWTTPPKPRFTVVSADAYTQGWIWRIAQAHTPGYSNLRFGYWAFAPADSFKPERMLLKALPS